MNTAAPYINTDKNVLYISSAHLVSLVPVMAAAVVYYGIRAAVLISFCALVFALSDELCSKISGKVYARDLSSLFYGAAYALLLPPDTPLYIALTGVLFGSIAVRQLSGGRGSALFNPAAAGRFFIRLVFPGNETAFAAPGADRLAVRSLLYGPEGTVSFDLSDYSTSEILAGRFPSFIGTACVFMILAGMIYLIIKGVLKAYIPVSYVAMLSILLFVCDVYLDTSRSFIFAVTSGILFSGVYLLNDDETTRSFGPISIFQAFICASFTVLMSFKTTGIDLIVIPVLISDILTGILCYIERVIRREGEGRLHAGS